MALLHPRPPALTSSESIQWIHHGVGCKVTSAGARWSLTWEHGQPWALPASPSSQALQAVRALSPFPSKGPGRASDLNTRTHHHHVHTKPRAEGQGQGGRALTDSSPAPAGGITVRSAGPGRSPVGRAARPPSLTVPCRTHTPVQRLLLPGRDTELVTVGGTRRTD